MVLVSNYRHTILAECTEMIKKNDNESTVLKVNCKFVFYCCDFYHYFFFLELQLLFKLMDRVPDGILKMLKDLEDYIVNAGLADMMASADIITQVIFISSLH